MEGLVDFSHFNPVRRQPHRGRVVFLEVGPAALEVRSQGKEEIGRGSDVEVGPRVESHFQDKFWITSRYFLT